MEYKFKLLKIHCAGCALALEQNINQIEGVQAEISFVTKVLKLQIDSDEPAETLTKVKMAISTFDKSIEIESVVSQEILTTLFYVGTVTHDGAVIIRNNKNLAFKIVYKGIPDLLEDYKRGK